METVLRDLQYALRILRRSPAFTITVIAVLALGIGANTAIFTVANALLLRPLPYADPQRLVLISGARRNQDEELGRLSYPFFNVVNSHNRSFSGVSACVSEVFNMTGRGDPEQVASARASWNVFDVLGVGPFVGRTFLPEEDTPGGKDVVLLSYEFAARLFGDARKAVGQNLTLDSRVYTVIGVLPPRFAFALFGPRRDIWAPRVFDMNFVTPARVALGGTYFNLIGRLRPGVSRDQATAELAVLYQQYRHDQPGNFDAGLNLVVTVRDLHEQLVAALRPALVVVWAAVAFLLLIACANVAGLLLSRAVGRRKEFAVRTVLGAPRTALARQLLTEGALLALISGGLGVLLGQAGTRILMNLGQDNLQAADLSMDSRILAFALAISILSSVLFGLTPALQISKQDPNSGLREESRGSAGNRLRSRARGVLVVAQIALSMVLLVVSGLLIRSFILLRTAAPGFDPQGLLTMQITLPSAKYPRPPQMIAFYNNTLQHLENLPGVAAATLSTALPVYPTHQTPVLFAGQPVVELGRRPIVNIQGISADYARVMRETLVAGRAFNAHDDAGAPLVAIVNQSTVKRFWPNESALGKQLWLGTMQKPFEVVGVFADTKNAGLAAAPELEVFMPYPQLPQPYLYLSLRTQVDPHSLVSAVRARIQAVDRDQPITDVMTMEEFLETLSAKPRFTMYLLSSFSAVAFILALVGMYALVAYSVAQRTQEMGIRIALGAASGDILRLVIGQGMALALCGIVMGILGSLAAARLMSGLLYQISATDPLTIASSAALFLAVAVLASFLPARRATRIDPAEALRAEGHRGP